MICWPVLVVYMYSYIGVPVSTCTMDETTVARDSKQLSLILSVCLSLCLSVSTLLVSGTLADCVSISRKVPTTAARAEENWLSWMVDTVNCFNAEFNVAVATCHQADDKSITEEQITTPLQADAVVSSDTALLADEPDVGESTANADSGEREIDSAQVDAASSSAVSALEESSSPTITVSSDVYKLMAENVLDVTVVSILALLQFHVF